MLRKSSSQHIKLIDGRKLAYAQFGPETGDPLFYFHGTPGSRLECPDISSLEDTNIRLITIDRPGIGESDFQPDRTLLDWPTDIQQLANQLELDEFSVLGYSGGAPYAAACAYRLSDRVSRLILVSGVSPFNIPVFADGTLPPNFALFEHAKNDYLALASQLAELAPSDESLYEIMKLSMAEIDPPIFEENGFKEMYLTNMSASRNQGYEGIAYDMAIIARDWGFDIAGIQTQTNLWHGSLDMNVPMSMSKYLAKEIPDSELHIMPNMGHTLIFHHWHEILQQVCLTESR